MLSRIVRRGAAIAAALVVIALAACAGTSGQTSSSALPTTDGKPASGEPANPRPDPNPTNASPPPSTTSAALPGLRPAPSGEDEIRVWKSQNSGSADLLWKNGFRPLRPFVDNAADPTSMVETWVDDTGRVAVDLVGGDHGQVGVYAIYVKKDGDFYECRANEDFLPGSLMEIIRDLSAYTVAGFNRLGCTAAIR